MIPRYNHNPLTGLFVLPVRSEKPAPSKYYIQRIRKDLEENPAKMIGVGKLHENLQAIRDKRARELRMVREASTIETEDQLDRFKEYP